jgi:hypothetical protein
MIGSESSGEAPDMTSMTPRVAATGRSGAAGTKKALGQGHKLKKANVDHSQECTSTRVFTPQRLVYL